MPRARFSAALLAALLCSVSAVAGEPSPPDRLAARFADAVVALARREGAGTVRVDVAAVAGDETLWILSLAGGTPSLIASAPLSEEPPMPPAEVATRDPRTFVRIVGGAGSGGEVLVRRSDESRTRVFGFESGKLVRRAD